MNGTRELETGRLRLRRYRMEDAALLHQYFGTDKKMYEFSGWNPYASPEMAEVSVREFIDSYEKKDFYGWAIELKKEAVKNSAGRSNTAEPASAAEAADTAELTHTADAGESSAAVFAGTVGAYDYDPETGSIEIGLSVRRDLWGMGIAGESLPAVLHYLTRVEKIPCVKAWCAAPNIGSKKAMEKAGMRQTAVEKDALRVGDMVYDKLDYEYRESREHRKSRESGGCGEDRECRESREHRESRECRESREFREHREYRKSEAEEAAAAAQASQPTDLTFRMDCGTFNYRVGAIIIHEGKILLMHNDEEPYYYTVGGRVHFNETTEETVVREVKEEIGADLEIDRFLFFQEQFFDGKVTGTHIHELGVYYLMKDSPDLEHLECNSVTARGVKEELHWIPLEETENYYIVPESIAARLPGLPAQPAYPEHIIEIDER